MNVKQIFFAATGLAVSFQTLPETTINRPTFFARPFCMDMAREIMAEQSAWANLQDTKNWFGTFQISAQYYHNLNSANQTGIGALPFWSGTNSMTVGNNAYGSTETYDVDAYQFGLGAVANPGTISISPEIYSAGINFFLYAGNHEFCPGVFTKFQFSIGASFMNPHLVETPEIKGVAYAPGLMSGQNNTIGAINIGPIYANMSQAFTGYCSAGNPVLAGNPQNSIFTGLQYGLINGKISTQTQLSDMDFTVGYNFVANDHAHVGLGLRLSVPIALSPSGTYLLEPLFGKGGGWGIGGELISRGKLWERNSYEYLELFVDGYIMHLFRGIQNRSYDTIANGKGSRYLLIGDFGSTGTTSVDSYQPLLNQTTLISYSIFPFIVDAAAYLQYSYDYWKLGAGYNISGRCQESLILMDSYTVQEFAIVGQQPNTDDPFTAATNQVDPTAKINAAMPSPQTAGAGGPIVSPFLCLQDPRQALDIQGARQPASWTSKIFAQAAYTWQDSNFCPTLAAQASTEFSMSGNTALSQWSIGIRGGISF